MKLYDLVSLRWLAFSFWLCFVPHLLLYISARRGYTCYFKCYASFFFHALCRYNKGMHVFECKHNKKAGLVYP